jgi:hypothetical protein
MRNATLSIEGQTFYLLDFSYSFGVDTDRKGRPASTLYGGTFVVTMESTSNTDMFRWLFGNKSEYKTLVSGKIEVESLYDETIFKRFEFESAYISTGSMHFEVGSSEWPRMTETFSIVALRLDVNKFLRLDRRKYEYGFNWNTYVPEPEIPMFVRPDNSYSIRDMYWLDNVGNKVRDLDIDSPVTLYVLLGKYVDGSTIDLSFEIEKNGKTTKSEYSGVVDAGVVVIKNFKA